MEAKLLKDPDNGCDYVLVSADEQSISFLNSGSPLRVAFFTDNNEGLPWYKRKAMVVVIGKDLDFNKHHKICKDGFFKKGLVDKSYLIDYIQKMKKKLIQMAMQELEVLDIPGEPMDTKAMIEHIEEAPEAIEEIGESINTAQAAEILNISYMTISSLIKKGLIKGSNNGFGWVFSKAYIENLLKERPDWLIKIWGNRRSYARLGRGNGEISRDNDTFIHIDRAAKMINLSVNTMVKYAKAGLIRHLKESGRDYHISVAHMGELRTNPPDWLKKSWRYFHNNKGE
ncbi:MAG: helix-turn-helix domain-containing protein [Candidatus Omnitrophica bacterium]|nr:helix-turn-helix domain-containing protein [Candidatus Omnitrophota bacterium]